MAGAFTAIPVGQGDAFLLERAAGTRILIDGGRARLGFSETFRSFVSPLTGLQVAVCTHADADHAEGIVGLLENGTAHVQDVWLPGRWTDRLADLCLKPEDFLHELFNQIRRDPHDILETTGSLTDAAHAKVPASNPTDDPKTAGLGDSVSLEQLTDALEQLPTSIVDVLDGVAHSPWLWPWPWLLNGPFDTDAQSRIWVEAVQTAERIRSVARAAHHRGARIRWFDFDEFTQAGQPSGGEPFLRPLNSVELTTHFVARKLGALDFLRLSVANQESLVFLAEEAETDSAVLFSADSDLACLQAGAIPASRTVAVTAPHHGSDANSAAYDRVDAALPGAGVVWVRSDGNYRKRPCPRFLQERGIANRECACTLCRSSGQPKRAVRLDDTRNGWARRSGTSSCGCK